MGIVRTYTCGECGSTGEVTGAGGLPTACPPCKITREPRNRKWERLHSEKHRQTMFRTNLRKCWLTPEMYYELVAAQGGRCAICQSTDPGGGRRWHVDHDHNCCPYTKAFITSCGKCIRGLLCNGCNTALGSMKDDPVILTAALAYVQRHRDAQE